MTIIILLPSTPILYQYLTPKFQPLILILIIWCSIVDALSIDQLAIVIIYSWNFWAIARRIVIVLDHRALFASEEHALIYDRGLLVYLLHISL